MQVPISSIPKVSYLQIRDWGSIPTYNKNQWVLYLDNKEKSS